MKPLKIAVSGINTTDNPGPGVPVAKSLKRSSVDCSIIGLSYDMNDPGHYLNQYIDCSYILPYPANGWAGIANRLFHIKKTHGLDAVIPCLDAELPLYIKYSDSLAELGIKTFLPTHNQFELRNKDKLAPVADAIGAVYPKLWSVYSVNDLRDVLEKVQFPIMIKGLYYKAYKVATAQEAIASFTAIYQEWGAPVLVQEVVHGEELNVVGVGDGEGGDLGLVAIKKQTTTSLGKIWSGVTINHPELLECARRFIKSTNWRGPFELECIVNNQTINLIEINPRFPAWVYFATGVGVNLPESLVQTMMGQKTNPTRDYALEKIYVRYTEEIICGIDRFSNLVTQGESHVVC